MVFANPEASFEGDPPAAAERNTIPDRRELALVAVERTRMPMVVTNPRQPDNPIVLANQAFLDLTGYTAGEVIGRNCRFLQGPETAAEDVDVVRRGLAAGEDHLTVELLNHRKDGSTFWNQLAISPVHDADGTLIYYFASQKDVSARRRAEELEAAERLLLMEIDHRAMNALALVQSIVRLSRTDTVQGYSGSVSARVDALARAHRLLARSGWAEATLADLVAMETPPDQKPRVDAAGPAALLKPQLVQPITLVLHELMANAAEHGALSHQGGKLHIRWESSPEQVFLRWRECGGSLPTEAPSPGFGLSLIKGVIERQLGGKLETNWKADGLDAQLTIPLTIGRAG